MDELGGLLIGLAFGLARDVLRDAIKRAADRRERKIHPPDVDKDIGEKLDRLLANTTTYHNHENLIIKIRDSVREEVYSIAANSNELKVCGNVIEIQVPSLSRIPEADREANIARTIRNTAAELTRLASQDALLEFQQATPSELDVGVSKQNSMFGSGLPTSDGGADTCAEKNETPATSARAEQTNLELEERPSGMQPMFPKSRPPSRGATQPNDLSDIVSRIKKQIESVREHEESV
jgi:hypothetical protein